MLDASRASRRLQFRLAVFLLCALGSQAGRADEAAWEAELNERRAWWSLQPVTRSPVPVVVDVTWSDHPVDRFILSRLEEKGLHPARRADQPTLIRRLTFCLTGLPPSGDDVREFVNDTSPQAWEKLVDRLLASPHFGERFARHWMDVVRYSDTYGYEWDIPAKGAWRYRDYLIRALNADVPFDQLVREHLAGDLLEMPRIHPIEKINESLIGLMFFQMGEKRHGDSAEFNGVHQEMLDDKINTFSKAFQATTVSCARCHDHKLDAVSQREYYALAGVFMSSRWATNTLDTPQRNQSVLNELRRLKSEIRKLFARRWCDEIDDLAAEMRRAGRLKTSFGWPGLDRREAPERDSPGFRTAPTPATRRDPSLEMPSKTAGPDPPLEDIRYPWHQIVKAAEERRSVPGTWKALQEQYATEGKIRKDQNASKFSVVADFRETIPEGWSIDGVSLKEPVACGDYTVTLQGPKVVGRLLPGGLFTHALSPRLNGALRTPYLQRYDRTYVSFQFCGGDFSAHRTIVDNAFLTERQKYLDSRRMDWLTLPTHQSLKDRKVYVELATKTSNPNFPPRMGLGNKLTDEEIRDPTSWFGVTQVVLHDEPGTPRDELTRFQSLFAGEPPQDLAAAALRYEEWFRRAIEVWGQDQASEDDVRLINWALDNEVLNNCTSGPDAPRVRVAGLVDRYRQTERELAIPQTINGMVESDAGYDYRLNVGGDYDLEGDRVPRGFLQALTQSNASFQVVGSGRRELAEIVARPSNPLTARVFVNRVWHWLFGRGIVATPNDFGRLGQPPTHPELLDYLAVRFVDDGWSVKQLVRRLVLTETWRQGSQAMDGADRADPANQLLHHYPLRRLEAEAIRDSILATSGQLERSLYGPPIDPPRVKEDPQKRLVSGPVDGRRRSSIYTKITIMEPPHLLAAFNQPKPKIPIGRRDVTNTPVQSLALLNDPFVTEQAERWAESLLAAGHESTDARLEQMFWTAFGRPPTEVEVNRWNAAIADLAALHHVATGAELTNRAIWKDIAHALFNTKEFVYVR